MLIHAPHSAPIGAAESQLLQELAEKILKQHFSAVKPPRLQWGIPAATEVSRVKHPVGPVMTKEVQARLLVAQCHIRELRWASAIRTLQPLADAGHGEATHLLIQSLKRTQQDYTTYAERYATTRDTYSVVPASSHDAKTDLITIHSYLVHRKAPQYVLIYLLYHEFSRREAIIAPSTPSEFTRRESSAPHRDKAQEWLKRHGFPVYQLT